MQMTTTSCFPNSLCKVATNIWPAISTSWVSEHGGDGGLITIRPQRQIAINELEGDCRLAGALHIHNVRTIAVQLVHVDARLALGVCKHAPAVSAIHAVAVARTGVSDLYAVIAFGDLLLRTAHVSLRWTAQGQEAELWHRTPPAERPIWYSHRIGVCVSTC